MFASHVSTYENIVHSQMNTHTHTKAKSLAAVKQSHPPSEALGWLGTTTQALKARAGKLTWGRSSTLQVGLYHVPG